HARGAGARFAKTQRPATTQRPAAARDRPTLGASGGASRRRSDRRRRSNRPPLATAQRSERPGALLEDAATAEDAATGHRSRQPNARSVRGRFSKTQRPPKTQQPGTARDSP